jgi:hypothetical protein
MAIAVGHTFKKEITIEPLPTATSHELDPTFAYAFAERCAAYNAKRAYERALADCDKAIELDP